MTEIVFKYNPIQVKANILVDGTEIAKTSNLYRYRNTPLEDWIDVLIPELVDYSNDDNIVIEICSLQKYIYEINKAIRSYEKKHRHVDIEVREIPSTGYKGRLNKISQIIEQINEEDDTLQFPEIYPLDVIVVSMADSDDYKEVLDSILPNLDVDSDKAIMISNYEVEEDGFETRVHNIDELEDRHVDSRVFVFPSLAECSNKYWRLLKEKVNGDQDYILIALLNGKPKKNDELFDYLAEQLEKKGKINRSRFVFISENPEDNLDYIQDEYGVRISEIIDFDDAGETLDKVKNYIQNVSYVRKISELSTLLKSELENNQEKISREAEKNKSLDELDDIRAEYRKIVELICNHYSSITLTHQGSYSVQNATEEFVVLLTNIITKNIFEDVRKISSDDKTNDNIPTSLGKSFGFYVGSSTSRSVVNDYLNLLKEGSKEAELIALTESVLNDFLLYYLSEHLSFVAKSATNIKGGLVLQQTYSITPLIEDKTKIICRQYVKQISEIEKKNESGKKIKFFEWVTENISLSDIIGIYSYTRTNQVNGNNNSTEVSKKIRRRIKTIEDDIVDIFSDIFMDLGLYNNSDILKKKINKIRALTEASMRRLEEKFDEAIDCLEISSEDKSRIANIDSLLSELEEVTNL